MTRKFDGKNSDSSLRMFFNRVNYDLNSFKQIPNNTDHVTDFSLGELRLYGRISPTQNIVIPQKNAITHFKGFDSSKQPPRCLRDSR